MVNTSHTCANENAGHTTVENRLHAMRTDPSKRLSHLSEEALGDLHSLVRRQVADRILEVFLDPAWQFVFLVSPTEPLQEQSATVTISLKCTSNVDAL